MKGKKPPKRNEFPKSDSESNEIIEEIEEYLKKIRKTNPKIIGSAVISKQGNIVASDLQDFNKGMAVIISSVLVALEESFIKLKCGEFRKVIIEGSKYNMHVTLEASNSILIKWIIN